MAINTNYYIPRQSRLPIIASIGVLIMVFGLGNMLNGVSTSLTYRIPLLLMLGGLAFLLVVIFLWLRVVVWESRHGMHGPLMDLSYRWCMGWFIFTEVMFFAAFFGTLFYVRNLAVPWLSSEGMGRSNTLLWPEFIGTWPLFENPDENLFKGPTDIIPAMQVPLLNTIILVSSSFTVTWAHHALKENHRLALKAWLITTILLGITFLYFQAGEYIEAYSELELRLNSGIYGSTFFMLTGFHGMHVTLGTVMLISLLGRVFLGHFTPQHHFAFEAVSWYWHFVDVVWIGLFLFVYIF